MRNNLIHSEEQQSLEVERIYNKEKLLITEKYRKSVDENLFKRLSLWLRMEIQLIALWYKIEAEVKRKNFNSYNIEAFH